MVLRRWRESQFRRPHKGPAGNICPPASAATDNVSRVRAGPKMGVNGVDNGRLWFKDVWVPRAALLDRFAQVRPGTRKGAARVGGLARLSSVSVSALTPSPPPARPLARAGGRAGHLPQRHPGRAPALRGDDGRADHGWGVAGRRTPRRSRRQAGALPSRRRPRGLAARLMVSSSAAWDVEKRALVRRRCRGDLPTWAPLRNAGRSRFLSAVLSVTAACLLSFPRLPWLPA